MELVSSDPIWRIWCFQVSLKWRISKRSSKIRLPSSQQLLLSITNRNSIRKRSDVISEVVIMDFSRSEMWMEERIWPTRSRWSGSRIAKLHNSRSEEIAIVGSRMDKKLLWDVYLLVIIEYSVDKQNIQLNAIKNGNSTMNTLEITPSSRRICPEFISDKLRMHLLIFLLWYLRHSRVSYWHSNTIKCALQL